MDYLQISGDEYDEKVLLTFWEWCSKRAQSASQEQELLANRAVNKWFMLEYEKRQQKFLKIFDDPVDVRGCCIEQYYDECITTIFNIYPKVLIDKLKFNPIFINHIKLNTPLFYAN